MSKVNTRPEIIALIPARSGSKRVVDKILAQMERSDLKSVILDDAPNEIPHQYLSAKKAREILGWQAEHDFESGLERTIPWYVQLLKEDTAK